MTQYNVKLKFTIKNVKFRFKKIIRFKQGKYLLSQKRLKLIEMVMEDGVPINQARQQLSIKYPTAKSIIQRYRKSHRVFEREP